MPMGNQSLVGDMGASLSVGKKRRGLIARALYRCAKILVMEEGARQHCRRAPLKRSGAASAPVGIWT